MTGNKAFGPPKGKSWTWVTRDVLSSAAWRSMAINTRGSSTSSWLNTWRKAVATMAG